MPRSCQDPRGGRTELHARTVRAQVHAEADFPDPVLQPNIACDGLGGPAGAAQNAAWRVARRPDTDVRTLPRPPEAAAEGGFRIGFARTSDGVSGPRPRRYGPPTSSKGLQLTQVAGIFLIAALGLGLALGMRFHSACAWWCSAAAAGLGLRRRSSGFAGSGRGLGQRTQTRVAPAQGAAAAFGADVGGGVESQHRAKDAQVTEEVAEDGVLLVKPPRSSPHAE